LNELLKRQYLQEGEHCFEDMIERVSSYVGCGREIMMDKRFLPNSPTLMNAGRGGQLSACFVLPIEDTMESIFGTLRDAALIHKSGGGTGFSFSGLRPEGDLVGSTRGVSSGPISFMKIYDVATEQVKQGGMRRGANMAVLRVDHPDIEKFIRCKHEDGEISNFNISVALTNEFMAAVEEGKRYALVNPKNNEIWGWKDARGIFNKIIEQAWYNGEPGILFIDKIEECNPTPWLGKMEATNPCGEQPLLPYESCNLGSINLGKHVVGDDFAWHFLGETVEQSVEFLNGVIDCNNFPLPQIKEATLKTRKIGLGVMGWADALIKMGIKYDSTEALSKAREVMRFIAQVARKVSNGRNITVTTIAPTGSISLLAGCSSGIEPIFSIREKRNHYDLQFERVHPLLEEGYDRELFRTAHDITWDWHVWHQATFQEFTDNAISKTINLPADADIGTVKQAVMTAYAVNCKGITVYRDKSRKGQVIESEDCERCVV